MPRASAELDMTTEWGVSARADAMAVEFINTSSPVFGAEPIIYGTPASAASLVDSVGQSTAWAAAPYPGDIMVGAADNGNGALVGRRSARASSPATRSTWRPPELGDKVQDQSGNRLVAHSEQYMSSSDARSGLITGDFLAALQAQAATRSSVDPTTGDLTAVADSRLDAFRFTDKLQIGRSVAHAKLVKTAGQELVKESSFTIGSIIVNGVEMSYGDGGFKFGDQAPSSPGDPKPLFDALKAAGITVEILPATGTDELHRIGRDEDQPGHRLRLWQAAHLVHHRPGQRRHPGRGQGRHRGSALRWPARHRRHRHRNGRHRPVDVDR